MTRPRDIRAPDFLNEVLEVEAGGQNVRKDNRIMRDASIIPKMLQSLLARGRAPGSPSTQLILSCHDFQEAFIPMTTGLYRGSRAPRSEGGPPAVDRIGFNKMRVKEGVTMPRDALRQSDCEKERQNPAQEKIARRDAALKRIVWWVARNRFSCCTAKGWRI